MVAVTQDVAEGELLWTPEPAFLRDAQLTRFLIWLESSKGLGFTDYQSLWRWSVDRQEDFWKAVWDYFGIIHDGGPRSVLGGTSMFDARWFEGARVNYAEHILRHEREARDDEIAICHSSETRPIVEMTWSELGRRVRRVATSLRELGVGPGDRVVSYMPNVVETAIAMLATVSIGGIWSSAAPEFGAKTVIERFGQISPKVIFVCDGYSFGGRLFDRRDEVAAIVSALPSLDHVIYLPYQAIGALQALAPRFHQFDDLEKGREIAREDFEFERLPWDAPLWILFSSGTTGLPKAIVHGHLGMTIEHLKVMTFHCNLAPGKRMFFYSTTGWMMWNSVMAAMICGATSILYDGSPVHGGADMLWRMASDTGATLFGASPTLVQSMKRAGIRPRELFDLSALDTIILGGAPSTPETFKWFYDDVKSNLWVTSQSGGTEICSGLVGGVPLLPVYAGEIQARLLGVAVDVWSDEGSSLVDAVGELVVTKPMPAAPLTFWGEGGRERYFDSYYTVFEQVWRHGDLAKINRRGGVYIYGRSDSTLNRYGVRIGTSEIYKIVDQMPEINDALVVCCETGDGGYFMPMFVTLEEGALLDAELIGRVAHALRSDASPRHVPDEILAAPAIPYTLTGKKMEVPIRRLLMGVPLEKAASRDVTADPELLDWYVAFASQCSHLDAGSQQAAVS